MADLPKPHHNDPRRPASPRPYEEMREERRSREPQKAPSARERYASDTETLSVPPEMYDSYDEPGSGYGEPDGYDPYDPPRRQRRVQSRRPVQERPDVDYRPPRAAYYDDDAPRRRASGRKSRPVRYRRHRSSCLGRIVRWLLGIFLSIFVLYSIVALRVISKLDKVGEAPRTVTTGSIGNANYTRTVLIIGTDSRDLTEERGRSDSMILVTINDATHELYMSSLMRDAYVEIPNRGYDKLNAAYSYGGAELLMDTIEENYDVSVDDYICVSFAGFANVIDTFGGVEITLSEEEAQAVNVILQSEVNELMGDDVNADLLPGGGTYALNGKQALAYARIRYVGNADFERTSRQREVMTELMETAKKHAARAIPDLLGSATPHISTNMDTWKLYLLSLRVPFAAFYNMRQQQIPADGTWWAENIDGQEVLQIDEDANRQLLRDTAYSVYRNPEE